MASYFQYSPPSGAISGKEFEEQTERAINELHGFIEEVLSEAKSAKDMARQANDAALQANDKADRLAIDLQNVNETANRALTIANNADANAQKALSIANEALRIASLPIFKRESWDAPLQTGQVLNVPEYMPGTGNLLLHISGVLMEVGRDYEEINETSVRLIREFRSNAYHVCAVVLARM